MENKFMFNGKEISLDELNKKMDELKSLTKMKAEAKKAGLIIAKKGAPKVKPQEVTLLAKTFEPVIVSNAANIAKLFEVDYAGQDSISMNVTERYAVIIRDRKITADKAETRKAEAKAKKDAEVKE